MKTLIKVLTIIIILTTNAYSEDNHKDHDHDNHDKDGFYGHLDVAIFADSMTKVANDGKYNEIYFKVQMFTEDLLSQRFYFLITLSCLFSFLLLFGILVQHLDDP